MRGGTVKQFLDALEEMRSVYPFKDEETQLCTTSIQTLAENHLTIYTRDEKTGIHIEMSKDIPREV